MHVYEDTNSVYCWGACRKSFGVISLWAEVNNLEFTDAADQLGDMFGIYPDDSQFLGSVALRPPLAERKNKYEPGVLPPPMDDGRAQMYHRQLTSRHYDWLMDERLIPKWLVDAMRIGHTPAAVWPPAYTIPLRDERREKLLTVRYRRDDEAVVRWHDTLSPQQVELAQRKYWGVKGRNHPLPFGLWTLGNGNNGNRKNFNDFIILLESELDTLALSAHGLSVLAITDGVHCDTWLPWIRYLNPFARWVDAFDDDEAGRLASAGLRSLYPGKVVRFPWPTAWDGTDATDFLRLFGFDAFIDRVEYALERSAGAVASAIQITRRYWTGWDRDFEPVVWISQ